MSKSSKYTFSPNKGHVGSYIVYVNGIEIPTRSVVTTYGVWEIPTTEISLAPDPVLNRLGAEDRVQVQVFFIDDFNDVPVPRLLAEGEITGWTSSLRAGEANLTFTVVNQIAVFTQLFVQFLTNVDDMAAHAVWNAQGVSSIAPTQSEIVFPYSLFTQGLIGTKFISRPFDILYNVVINMIGSQVPEAQRSVPVTNFFSRWARITNFVNRFVATPVFDSSTNTSIFPVLKAVQTTSALDVLTRALIPYVRQLQNAGSIWDTLQLIFQTMLTEIVMLPTAPLVSVDLTTSEIKQTDFSNRTLSNGIPSSNPDPATPNRLLNYFVKPQFIFGLPPACNIIFPSMIESFQYSENYATQPTRLYFNNETIHQLFKVRGQLDPAIMAALATAWPPEAERFQKAKASGLKSTGKNFLIFPEEFYKGPVMDTRIVPTWLFFLKQAELSAKKSDSEVPADTQPAIKSDYQPVSTYSTDIYELYAEYEFYREKYSRRSGAVICKFNPFIVPGFPAIVFDNVVTKQYLFCYVTNVQHTLTTSSVQTTVSFSYGRTLYEVFGLLKAEFEKKSTAIGVSPRDPIQDISDTIQHFGAAEQFYQALFFGKMASNPKDACGQWFKVLAYENEEEGAPESIFITGTNDAFIRAYNEAVAADTAYLNQLDEYSTQLAQAEAELIAASDSLTRLDRLAQKTAEDKDLYELNAAIVLASQIRIDELTKLIESIDSARSDLKKILENPDIDKKVRHNLDTTKTVVPSPAFEEAFESYDVAMKYVWRPICSLDEYIIFMNSKGENPIPAFGTPNSIGAVYYERIRRMIPLTPDTVLPVNADGVGQTNDINGSTPITGLPFTFPQTREDWDKILLAYRNNVYISKVPRG